MDRSDRISLGITLMMFYCLLAPLIDVASKLAVQEVPAGTVTLWRYIWQGALMLPVVLLMRLPFAISARAWRLMAIRGAVSAVATFSFVASLRVMPIADALAISFVEPFVILLIGHFVLRETVGPRRLAACAVGFVGVLFVIQPSFVAFGMVALLPLATAVCFALYILVTRQLSRLVHPVTMQLHTSLTGAIACLPFLLLGSWADIAVMEFVWPHGQAWIWLFGVGFCAAVTHMGLTYAFSYAPASTLATLHYFEILSATLYGYLVFNDFPNMWSWVGIGIIIASGVYLIYRERINARIAVPA